jgi:hypothetical protein
MDPYRVVLVLKFVGVFLYVGGLTASFVASTPGDRKRAVHAVASPGLVVTWLGGYLLTTRLGVPLTECWVVGALIFSFVSQLALVRSVSRERSAVALVATSAPLLLVLVLMVFRPTWAELAS